MTFDSELDLWEWTGTLLSTQHTDTLIVILATLPVCECERSISMSKLIKTSLRSTMTQKRLKQYHKDIPVTADELVCTYPSS